MHGIRGRRGRHYSHCACLATQWGCGACWSAARLAAAMAQLPYVMHSVPGFRAKTPGVQIGQYINADCSDDDLRLMQQLGCEWAMVTGLDDAPELEVHTAENYLRIKERFARFDVQVYRIGHHRVHNVPEITLNLPGRDERINEFCRFITELGKAGIHYNTYAHMATGIWSSGSTTGRGGTTARVFDPKTAVGHWNGRTFNNEELVHGRMYTEGELWENYTYFIKKVAPVAEAAGVFIGIHPDDPPVYPLGGVPRALFGSFDGYCKALEIADSPNIGACLCLGCWLEGGKELMGADGAHPPAPKLKFARLPA